MRQTLRVLVVAMLFSTFGFAIAGETGAPSAPQPAKVKKAATKVAKKKTAAKKSSVSKRISPAGRSALLSRAANSGWKPVTNAATDVPVYAGAPNDLHAVHPVKSPALRKVHPIPPPKRGEEDDHEHREPVRPTPPTDDGTSGGVRQAFPGAESSAPTFANVSFDGVGVGLGGYSPSSNPPDVNGRVGATQYVQWNNTSFAVFSKTGTLLYGPAAGNTLFQSLGGVCASHNDGDPVVSYDILAGRWVLSQFVVDGPAGSASHQCFAVSMTDDALGSYYLYDFVTDPTNFVDYPHVGVWPDGYYMTTHVFNAAGTAQVAARVHVFEREKMILGLPARQVQKDLGKNGSAFQYGFLPADLDSTTPPPAGEASFVIGPNGQFTNRTDTTRVAVTWGTTPTIALTEAVISGTGITTPACVNNTAAQDNRDCVPQPSPAVGADYLDNISFHYMYRLAYRNFGGSPVQESLVVSAPTAGSASTPGHGAIKWIEFRNAGNSTATPTVFQSATFDPDTAYRWLPSIAMDKDHNIALGYSKSSTSIKPGIYMTGRLGTDTINTMGAETTVQAGVGSQTTGAGNRWGDYSAMTLDPIDQCTFWYTNEYLKTNGAFNWSTRISAYKFPSCTPATAWATVSGNVTSCATGVPLSGIIVSLSNGFAGATDASGNYTIQVPAGTYNASAAGTDRNCTTGSPATVSVIATSGATTTQNFCMTGASNLQTNGITLDDATNGNNNGIVNRDECVRMNVALKNNGCANETAISATLSTATAGVTVTQASSTYSDLAVDAGGTNATPFKFQTSSSFVCGTVISFTLTTNYASGSKALTINIPTCSGGADQSIPSSSLTAADLTQADRLGRDGVPSTCSGKTSPGGGFAGTKYYKTFTFTNNSGVATCYTVNLTAALGGAGDIESAAYSPAYLPASIDTNFLGDSGISGLGTTVGNASYSFTVPALSTFVVVVNTTGTTTSSVFSGTVSGFVNTAAGPGACPACVPPATPTVSAGGPTTFCQGGSVTLTSSSATGNQWYDGTTLLAGQTNQTYVATTSGSYNVIATVAGCASAASASTAVTVNPTPATPTITPGGPTTFCAGGSVTLTSSSVTGNQWYLGGNPIGGATGQQYVASAAGSYTVIVTTSGCSSAASATTTVTVNPIPATPTITPGGPTTFCAGSSVTLTSSSATGNQWYFGGNPIGGATSQAYVATATGSYTVVVTTSGCASAASSATSVTVNPIPATPTITPGGPTTFCAGGSVTLTSSSATGNQWYLGGNPIGGATSNQYVATATGSYTVIVTTSGCASAASAATSVTVNPIPATPTITPGGPTTFCPGGNVTLTSSSATGNQWYLGGNPIGGATSNQYVASASGSYTVVVTTSGCASAASSATTVTVNPANTTPTITPSGPTTFCAGGSVTLTSSSATGNQWYLGGNPIGGATGQQYIATASGSYTVIATVTCPSAASAATTVTVNPLPATPTITPDGPTTFCAGGSVTLTSSSATGNQWYLGGNPIGGATSQAYVATATGNYTVIVTTGGCSSAASSATSVTVTAAPATPTITPGGPTTFCAGGNVTLTSSSATGNQWYLNGNPIGGETNQQYVATAAGNYTVVVTASGCPSAPSAATAVTVNPLPATPTITPDGPTTFCAGGSVTLTSSSATGNQWYLGGNPIGGATSQAYVATATGSYTVVVTTSGCSSAASSATSVTVTAAPATPTITPGGPTTFCAGGSVTLTSSSATGNQWYLNGNPIGGETNQQYVATAAGNYTVVVTASGCPSAPSAATAVTVNPIPSTPTITPGGPTTFCAGGSVTLTSSSATGNQWYLGGNPIGGATSNQYVASASGSYTVVVTTSGCSSAASSATSVTVNPIPATPTITPGGPTTFCAGGSVTLTSSSATGNQWYLNGNPIGGETNQQYIATASGNYTVGVTTSGCSSAASSATAVTVNPAPATPTITPGGPTTFCAGGSVTLTSSSATGNQWYLGGNPIGGATSNQYVASASGSYTVVVTTSGCSSAASSATSVTVNPIPSTPTITPSGPTTFCAGGSVTLTSSSATGNQWYLNGNPIGGETNQQYIATASGNYTVVVTASGCPSAPSSAAAVTATPLPPTPTITPGGPTTFCAPGSVTFTSSSATGNQWYLANTLVPGETGQTFTVTSAMIYATGQFYAHVKVTVTTSGCSSTSASSLVEALQSPTPTISAAGPTTFCTGGSVELDASIESAGQWYRDNTLINGATGFSYIATTSGSYTFVNTFYSSCPSTPSNAIVVTVAPIPATPTITPGGPTTFCAGSNVTLTSSSASGNQWYLNGNPIGGATAQQYIANASGNYTVTVTTSGCASAPSSATAVTVNAIPATPTITPGGPTTFCAGGSVTLTSSSVTGNQWALNGNPIGGATNQQFIATATGNYTVVVTTSGCSSAASAATAVTVNPIPAAPTITPGGPTTFCSPLTVTLTSSVASGNQWYLNGNPIGGATGQQYVAAASGSYTVTTTASGCTSAASAATVVTVNICYHASSDLNSNNMSDIVLQNTNTNSVAAWLMEDNTLVDGKVVFNPTAEMKIAATGDLDGDLKSDIIVKNTTTGAISMWKMNSNVLVSQTIIATPSVAQRVVATYDFNHDGKDDIVLQNSSTGAVSLWLMNGATLTTGIALGNPGLGINAVAVGKFGGDAILFQNSSSGQISRWTISGNAVTSNLVIGTPAAGTNVVAAADFDGDTNTDIALQQTSTRTVSVWLIGANGTTITQSAVVATPVFDWKVVGAGDYNGNGKGDLLLHNPATNGIAQWQMNGVVIDRGWNISTIAGWVPLGR